jgi:nucleoside phosphorylase
VRQTDLPSRSDPAWEGADLLLLTGLHEELEWLHRVFGIEFEGHIRLGTSYFVGELKRGSRNVRIVTLLQQEKGLTNSAITATKALCTWKPTVAVMTGICAGVKGSVNLGDLVVATQCFEHSSGQLRDGAIIPLQNRVSTPPWLLNFLMTLTDSKDLQMQIRNGFGQSIPADAKPTIHYGSMACGPQVIKDKAYIDNLKNREHSLLAIDMESYGISLAASMCSTVSRPIHSLVVKGVCDFADSAKSDEWHDYCAYASATFVKAVLDRIFTRDRAYAVIKGVPDHG